MGRALLRLCVGLFCLGLVCVAGGARAEEGPAVIDLGDVVVYPARASEARPITVLLHGMCGEPTRTCSHFASEISKDENLICPRASVRCEGGGASWAQAGVAAAVAAAVEHAKAVLPVAADETHGRTLIGYSLGAYRAIEIAQSTPHVYPRVMLIGAKISINRGLLAENGVERVLLSAGQLDMMHEAMQREAARAARAGFTAHFLDLGPVGHAFTPSFAEYLPLALAWLRAS